MPRPPDVLRPPLRAAAAVLLAGLLAFLATVPAAAQSATGATTSPNGGRVSRTAFTAVTRR